MAGRIGYYACQVKADSFPLAGEFLCRLLPYRRIEMQQGSTLASDYCAAAAIVV